MQLEHKLKGYKNFGRSFFRFITIHAFDRQRDRWTDGNVVANTALHSMQSG